MISQMTHHHYTREELKELDPICRNYGLSSLLQIMARNNHSPYHVYDYIKSTMNKKRAYFHEEVTDTCAEFHRDLFRIMFEVPFHKLPLEINQEPLMMPFVKWRLRINK